MPLSKQVTDGPWQLVIRDCDPYPGWPLCIDRDNESAGDAYEVAVFIYRPQTLDCMAQEMGPKEAIANGYLMAASRELFEALERLENAALHEGGLHHDTPDYGTRLQELQDAMAQARAALAKAQGQTT